MGFFFLSQNINFCLNVFGLGNFVDALFTFASGFWINKFRFLCSAGWLLCRCLNVLEDRQKEKKEVFFLQRMLEPSYI